MAVNDKNYDIATESSQNSLSENTQGILNKLGDFSSSDTVKNAIVSLSNQVTTLQTELAEVKSAVSSGGSETYITSSTSANETNLKVSGSVTGKPDNYSYNICNGGCICRASGTITLKITGGMSGTNYSMGGCYVLINGARIVELDWSNKTSATYTKTIPVEKGNAISFEVYAKYSYPSGSCTGSITAVKAYYTTTTTKPTDYIAAQ